MNQGMASLAQVPAAVASVSVPTVHHRGLKLFQPSISLCKFTFSRIPMKHPPVCCTKMTPWEPSPITYALTDDKGSDLLKGTSNIFETLDSDGTAEAPVINTEELLDTRNQASGQLQFLKWPMWILGPSLLLATGMVPTLWLPISSIFLGPNIASLLSLIGLDCIFNLGATLFLLMADACARPKNPPTQPLRSKAPSSYRFWNLFASISGLAVPLTVFFGSQNGFFQTQLPFLPFAVLLGPYFLLLSVQMLTEMLTWHWQSPVWLVTPVVYESYRVLQLMRGLKLGAELSAPAWMMNTVRGLVCWWVLILGMQLMRVVWFAGFSAGTWSKKSSALAYD